MYVCTCLSYSFILSCARACYRELTMSYVIDVIDEPKWDDGDFTSS